MTDTKQNKGDGVDENFKSDFLIDAERAQQKLDTVSPSFCLAKWKQLSLHSNNRYEQQLLSSTTTQS